ncbi:hypothetical protein DUNSADRAFT_15055 [Dunaliella salina]|uniref:Uncharacterized protein n=1 Tax=Dunaliella salina TaxID=3046 RepID=A0ABQ7G632_DUNSA|nr:hypothetical protein DUNSADRAFT_15055 [Dunaliella salina]|eukprot:KAF5830073.1 hypothetical protein DUNSADRAFT_15055 [Dunaliella salina]
MELQAIRTCLAALSTHTSSQQQIDGLRNVCNTIEAAEGKFRDVCGVPYLLGGSKNRSHQLNKILAVIKDNEDAYEKVADSWVLHSSASLQQQAVGLRFLFCTLSCWGYQVG